MKFAVFVSGNGSNFEAIANAVNDKKVKADLKLVVCDNKDAFALERAKRLKIPQFIFLRKEFKTKQAFETEILKLLKKEKIDFIVLAGFMRILSPTFVEKYKNKILNIHPSLLPKFKGAHAIEDAFNAGVKVTGVTVHFVDEKVDNGPIILQKKVEILSDDSLESLKDRVHKIEHQIYPQAINFFINSKKFKDDGLFNIYNSRTK